MPIITGATNLHFSGTGADTIQFGGGPGDTVGIFNLILTTSGDATISFDGETFMPLANTTHQFTNLNLRRIHFGAGTWAGVGLRY